MKSLNVLLMAVFSILALTVTAQNKAGKKDNTKHTQLYTCPMHDTVAAKKPGNCTVCGMKLELSKKEQMKTEVTKSYNCPMHADVSSDKPGKCSKCGMDLVRSKEKMKTEVMNQYVCPMHSDVTSNKPGKCSKCGMDLKKKEDHSNHNH
ncbi:heavy metal-binding domain-containing protein [Lacibacter luteus]|uniref:heavy metal-binding domain-containing protein n=1 Tax=Lacibacter luteus TaxID=2508719 RepID=UPI00197B9E18|nr:heavy metal-binding domain-containing protein [Lacibacter luteus]